MIDRAARFAEARELVALGATPEDAMIHVGLLDWRFHDCPDFSAPAPSVDTLCRRCEDLARLLAPFDLAGVPVYCVASHDLPYATDAAAIQGITSGAADLAFRAAIGDRWQGRGVAWMLTRPDVDVPRAAAQTSIHELAHRLVATPMISPVDESPAAVAALAVDMAASITSPTPTAGPTAEIPFLNHGGDWVRAMVHLAHRQLRLGCWLAIHDLLPAGAYGLSDEGRYVEALGDEPERFQAEPFATITATRPPEAFVRLWRDDVWAWVRTHQTLADSQAAEVVRAVNLWS